MDDEHSRDAFFEPDKQDAFEAMLASMGMRYWEYDIATHRLYRSALVQEEVGYCAYKDNVPESFVTEGIIHPDYAQAYLDFYHHIQQGRDERLRFRSKFADGSWGWLDISYKVLFDEKGQPQRAIGVGGDVTRQLKTEQTLSQREAELQQALDVAQQASNAKSEFLSRMSHDLRTPLNAIINLADLAKDDLKRPEELKADLHKIKIAGSFMLSLVSDILEMTSIETHRFELHASTYRQRDFVDFVDGVISPLCAKKGITFAWDPQNTPDIAISCDAKRLEQVFFNLISNAINYTDRGGTVTFTAHDAPAGTDAVAFHFRIADTGCGMSQEFQQRMFDPFERENVDSAYQGTGLGLPIARSIVEKMGGTIAVSSKLGEGTTVDVDLAFPLATGPSAETPSSGGGFKQTGQAGKRILIVEDHPMNREIVCRILRKRGYAFDCASNGKEAVELVAQSDAQRYSAVLMDVRMPVMDGLEATRFIRTLPNEQKRTLPIIAVTANASEADKKANLASGMNLHLSKPVDPNELLTSLETYAR